MTPDNAPRKANFLRVTAPLSRPQQSPSDATSARDTRPTARTYLKRWRYERAHGHRHKVDAAPVRDHVERLVAAGVGKQRIAELAGLSKATLTTLFSGQRGRPAKLIRATTAAAILAVQPDHRLRSAHQKVSAVGTQRRLQARLSVELGMTSSASSLRTLLQNRLVTVRRAEEVRALYDRLWDVAPPATTPKQQASVTRAQRYARVHGWVPPLAWDDNAIDDPAATPDVPAAEACGEQVAVPVVDDVAIERVIAGRARLTSLTDAERVVTAGRLAAQGATEYRVSKVLRCNAVTARQLLQRAQPHAPVDA